MERGKMDAKTTGKFISILRKEKNMTQTALAEELNISNRTVSKWENGDGFPDITILPQLASILSVSVDELLKGEKSEKTVKITEIANKDNLDNLFQITYVISLFIAIFSALLGAINELYCIWAFKILFYTHWEIIFAATALFACVLSGLIYAVGVTRLGVLYSREDIINKTYRKTCILSFILSIFPVTFFLRILSVFIPTKLVWVIAIFVFLIITIAFLCFYLKKDRSDNK